MISKTSCLLAMMMCLPVTASFGAPETTVYVSPAGIFKGQIEGTVVLPTVQN